MAINNSDIDKESIRTPQNIEAEEALLGTIFIKPDLIGEVMELVNANDFYKNNYKLIFSEMVEIHKTTTIIDSLVLLNSLRKKGILDEVGGEQIVYDLTDVVPTAANYKTYAQIIKDNANQRKMIDLGTRITEKVYRGELSPAEIEAYALAEINQIASTGGKYELNQCFSFNEAQELEEERARQGKQGIEMPFPSFEKYIFLEKSALITIGARPGVGKTAFGLNIARLIAKQKKNVLYVNLEMSISQIINRIHSAESQVPLWKIVNACTDDYEKNSIMEIREDFKDLSLDILNTEDKGFMAIINKITRLHSTKKYDLIIFDYLTLMTYEEERNKNLEVEFMANRLKSLATQLDTCIITMAQLNREIEKRNDKTPTLSDLRDSGGIEQASNVIMFLEQIKVADFAVLQVHIKKNRQGTNDVTIPLFYDLETQVITDDKMAIEITIQQWEQANKNIMKGNSKGGDNLPGYSY